MTHCTGYAAAALAPSKHFASIGIDAEPHQALLAHVLPAVADPHEIAHLAHLAASCPHVAWTKLLFSAKEAVYKAWWTLELTHLTFCDIQIAIDPSTNTFTALIHRHDDHIPTKWTGQWALNGDYLATAVLIPHSSDNSPQNTPALVCESPSATPKGP